MMRIRGRVVSKGRPVADAALCIWLIKRSDGAEFFACDGKSVDNGTLEVSRDVLHGLLCNSEHFIDIKYSVEKAGYRTVRGTRPIVGEEINMGDIELEREALAVRGRVSSNGRPVKAAKVIVCIDDVERACIRADHQGMFAHDIEGNYEGRSLAWTVKRFGYIRETGTISDIRSNQLDLDEIRLAPRWFTGFCQILGIDPAIALWIGAAVLLGLAILVTMWPQKIGTPPRPCDPSFLKGWQDFNQAGKKPADTEGAFDECLSTAEDKCAGDRDNKILQCMESKGYIRRK